MQVLEFSSRNDYYHVVLVVDVFCFAVVVVNNDTVSRTRARMARENHS